MVLGLIRTAVLLGGLALLGWLGGPLWACGGVGLGFGAYAFLGIMVACKLENISPWPLLRGLRGPLLACVPMVAAVLARPLPAAGGGRGRAGRLPGRRGAGGRGRLRRARPAAGAGVARELFMVLRTHPAGSRPRAPRAAPASSRRTAGGRADAVTLPKLDRVRALLQRGEYAELLDQVSSRLPAGRQPGAVLGPLRDRGRWPPATPTRRRGAEQGRCRPRAGDLEADAPRAGPSGRS